MKKLFTYVLILTTIFFSFLPHTYALDSCSPLSSATLYDIYDYNSLSPLSTTTREGTICSNAYMGYGDLGPTGALGYLANLSNLYSKDTYYTVSFYLFSTTNASLTATNLNNGYLAISNGNSANAWASSNFGVSDVTSSINYYSYEGSGLVYSVFTYIFKANTNFDSIFIPFSSSTIVYSADFQLYGVSITNTGRDSLTSTEIDNLLTSQTDEIKNQIDNLEENIDNTIKDTIDDTFKECRPSKNLFNKYGFNEKYNSSLTITDDYIRTITTLSGNGYYTYVRIYLDVNDLLGKTITVSGTWKSNGTVYGNIRLLYRDDNGNNKGTILEGTASLDGSIDKTVTIPSTLPNGATKIALLLYSNAGQSSVNGDYVDYYDIMVEEGSQKTSYEPYGEEICQNIIGETNDKLDNIQDSITSETPPNLGGLSGSAGWLPAGPVDSILNLPLTMLNSLLNNLGNSCTPLELPLPYVNRTLTLPCVNSIYAQIDGLNAWINTISIIASAFILYSYLLKLYKWVDDTLTFRENNHCDWGGV